MFSTLKHYGAIYCFQDSGTSPPILQESSKVTDSNNGFQHQGLEVNHFENNEYRHVSILIPRRNIGILVTKPIFKSLLLLNYKYISEKPFEILGQLGQRLDLPCKCIQ